MNDSTIFLTCSLMLIFDAMILIKALETQTTTHAFNGSIILRKRNCVFKIMIMLSRKLTRFPNNRLVLGDSESRFLLINGRCRPFCFLYWCFRLYARTSKQKHATLRRNETIYTSKVWISVKTTWKTKKLSQKDSVHTWRNVLEGGSPNLSKRSRNVQ